MPAIKEQFMLSNEHSPCLLICYKNNESSGISSIIPSSTSHLWLKNSTSLTVGDVIGFGLDIENNNFVLFKNGESLIDLGDISKYYVSKPNMTDSYIHPIFSCFYSTNFKIEVNVGQKDTYYTYNGYSAPEYYDTIGNLSLN